MKKMMGGIQLKRRQNLHAGTIIYRTVLFIMIVCMQLLVADAAIASSLSIGEGYVNYGRAKDVYSLPDNLTEVVETRNIVKTENGTEANGTIIDMDSLASMNMWGLTPEFFDVLEAGFKEFFEKDVPNNPLKAEYLIPVFIGDLLNAGKISVKVLKSNDAWYGMTYKEDVAVVRDSFRKMMDRGIYKADLFSDL